MRRPLRDLLGDMQVIMVWVCPVVGHSERKDPPRQTVAWDGDVARCLEPGCGRTSQDFRAPGPLGSLGST